MIAYKRATETGDAITKAKLTLYGRIGPQERLSGNSVNTYAICESPF